MSWCECFANLSVRDRVRITPFLNTPPPFRSDEDSFGATCHCAISPPCNALCTGLHVDDPTPTTLHSPPTAQTTHSFVIGTPTNTSQRQGHSPPQGQEGPQDRRHRRQEAPGHPEEDERAAHPGHRGGQHVQGGRQRDSLCQPPR